MNRILALLLGFAIIVGGGLLLLGPDDQPQQMDQAPVAAVEEETEQILRMGVVSLPPALGNPYRGTGVPTIYTYRAMFEGLTFVTEEGEVKPNLATAWQRIDDLTWQFDLRQDAVFHNGVPFTADAVVFAVNYLTSPEATVEPIARDLAAIESAEALDDYTVQINTEVPTTLVTGAGRSPDDCRTRAVGTLGAGRVCSGTHWDRTV